MQITVEQLMYGDRSVLFKINPGDAETPANISAATVKEMALAINVSNERIQDLNKRLEEVEARFERFERMLASIAIVQE